MTKFGILDSLYVNLFAIQALFIRFSCLTCVTPLKGVQDKLKLNKYTNNKKKYEIMNKIERTTKKNVIMNRRCVVYTNYNNLGR